MKHKAVILCSNTGCFRDKSIYYTHGDTIEYALHSNGWRMSVIGWLCDKCHREDILKLGVETNENPK